MSTLVGCAAVARPACTRPRFSLFHAQKREKNLETHTFRLPVGVSDLAEKEVVAE